MSRTSKSTLTAGVAALALAAGSGGAVAFTQNGNEITLRMGSGHGDKVTYVEYMQNHFAKRVSERAAILHPVRVPVRHHQDSSRQSYGVYS